MAEEKVKTLYRAGMEGVSWTTNRAVAEDFAELYETEVQELELTDEIRSRIMLYERATPSYEGFHEAEVVLSDTPISQPTPLNK